MKTILVESERLLVRRPEERDEPLLERVFGDPAMMRFLGGTWNRAKVREALEEWHAEWGVDNRWSGVLVKRDTQQAIGTGGCTQDTVTGEPGVELSWFVLSEHQGQGFATEISREILRFAFGHQSVERMVAETHPENLASNRVLGRLGFVSLGERRHEYDYLPGFDIQVVWQLTRERWERGVA